MFDIESVLSKQEDVLSLAKHIVKLHNYKAEFNNNHKDCKGQIKLARINDNTAIRIVEHYEDTLTVCFNLIESHNIASYAEINKKYINMNIDQAFDCIEKDINEYYIESVLIRKEKDFKLEKQYKHERYKEYLKLKKEFCDYKEMI